MSKKPERKCAECGVVKPIQGRGMCGRCYHRALRAEKESPKASSQVVEGLELEEQVRPLSEETKSNGREKMGSEVPSEVEPAHEDIVMVHLEFTCRDQGLLGRLSAWAMDERRSLPDQILYALDNVMAERVVQGIQE